MGDIVAYYHFPTVWVFGRPRSTSSGELDLAALADEVFRDTLTNGIDVRVLREGMFIFDFSRWPPGQDVAQEGEDIHFDAMTRIRVNQIAVLNSHLACLYTSLSKRQKESIKKMALSPSDVILMSPDGRGMSFSDSRVGALALARYPTLYPPGLPIDVDWRVGFRQNIIEDSTLRASFDLLNRILSVEAVYPQAILITDLYTRACKYFEDHHYALCLIAAWTICEQLLDAKWRRYIDANRDREEDSKTVRFINSDRRKKLLGSRDFTASVIAEFLSLLALIPYQLYRDLERVRSKRNDWIHELKDIMAADARLSVETAQALLSDVWDIDLNVPLIRSLSW